jgi:hypothetical protein
MRWLMVAGLLTAFFTARGARGEDAAGTATVDPSGTWKWDVTFNDNTSEFQLKLKLDDGKLTGKYTAFDVTTDIDDTKLEKDQLSFVSHREFNGNKFDVHFAGKVEPAAIDGKVTVDFGQGPQDFDWHAKRVADAADVSAVVGTWQLHMETGNGPIDPKITITQDEKGLHGAYSGRFAEHEAQNLTFKDGELSWEVAGERDGNTYKVVYHGKPEGDSIKGTNEFDFNGTKGTIEFTGKRTPAEKKAGDAKSADAAPPAATGEAK